MATSKKKKAKSQKEKAKSKLVHVVKIPDTSDPSNLFVTTFTDNDEGNLEAYKLMFEWAMDKGYEGDDFEVFQEEVGDVYENDDCMILITHS